ncbi:MAG: rod shape-determining protein MreD [Gallionellaceae bacterium]|jgi:rod shape-determining protein MreD|nr:rod shape-determining protein MreD [Gallionellaceae bacterium]
MSKSLSRRQEFIAPARGRRIAITLFVALLLNWLPWNGIGLALRPDFVALVLLYWCMREPARVGIGIAWLVGIFADVGDASLFGQHALAYSVMAFGAYVLHRRVQMLSLRQQTLQVFPVLLLAYLIYAAVHWQVRGYLDWTYFLGCVVSAALWAPASLLLRAFCRPRSDPNTL